MTRNKTRSLASSLIKKLLGYIKNGSFGHLLRFGSTNCVLTAPSINAYELGDVNLMPQKFFSLGALAEPESLYTDTALTKKEIGQLTRVSRQTVVKWDKIANQVTEYRQDYPMKTDTKFERDRTVPLSPYQVWVISRVGHMMLTLKDSKRVINYVSANPQFFSKSRYQFKCSQINQEKTA